MLGTPKRLNMEHLTEPFMVLYRTFSSKRLIEFLLTSFQTDIVYFYIIMLFYLIKSSI